MKSLLVDALRQAQGGPDGASSDNRESDPRDEATIPSEPPSDHDATELNLLETGVFEGTVSSESDVETIAGLQDEAPGAEDTDTDPAPEDEPTIATMQPTADDADVRKPRSLIARMGRFSPLICLLAMSLSAGAYMLYQNLTVVRLNDDLRGMSEQARGDRRNGAAHPEWTEIAPTEDSTSPAEANKLIDQIYSSGESRSADTGLPEATPMTASTTVHGGNIEIAVSGRTKIDFDDRAYALVTAGYNAHRQEDYGKAEKQYRAALAIEPNHRNALLGLAAVLQKTSRAAESVQYHERLLRINPDDTVAAAAILLNQPADSEIESSIKVLLQRHPDAAHLHFALGSHLGGLRRWPEARLAFLNAHQIEPGNSDYSYNLAVAMEQLGRLGEARVYYETALATANEDSTMDRHTIEKQISRLASITQETT